MARVATYAYTICVINFSKRGGVDHEETADVLKSRTTRDLRGVGGGYARPGAMGIKGSCIGEVQRSGSTTVLDGKTSTSLLQRREAGNHVKRQGHVSSCDGRCR